MSTVDGTENGFFTFYREYAHTAIHTVTATALTAFGLLTFVHWSFVILAIAVYVLPPIYLYLSRDGEAPTPVGAENETGEPASASDPTDAEPADNEPIVAGGQSAESSEPAATETAPSGSENRDSVTENTSRSEESTAEPSVSDSPSGAAAATPEQSEGDGADADGSRTTGERKGTASAEFPDRSESDRAESDEADDKTNRDDKTESGDETDENGERDEAGETSEERREQERREHVEAQAPEASEEPEESEEIKTDDGSEGTGAAEIGAPAQAEWSEIDSPTNETLFDAVAVGKNAYAAGENGVLLAREEGWEIALDHGPAAESTTLRGVDGTRDGNAVWVAGDSGVLGRYDPETGRHTDHSAPDGITDNWTDLAVAGAAGEERISLVNGSGQVLFGEYNESAVEWDEPVKPGSGSSMSAIEFIDESTGYCCDTNSGVYEISSREFERIGIDDGGSFTALAAADETVCVTDDDGTVQRFDGTIWTPLRAAENALSAIDSDSKAWIAVGAGGKIYEQRGDSWESVDTSIETNLHGVATGATPVAVGDEGIILERS